jgi:hypothetical protein
MRALRGGLLLLCACDGKKKTSHVTKRALLCYYSTISRGAFNEY